MTSTITVPATTVARPPRWRRGIVVACLALAGALLASMTWAVVQVTWFTATADYCDAVTCTGAAMQEAWAATDGATSPFETTIHDTLMVEGETALVDGGVSPAEFYFGHPMIVVYGGLLVLTLLLVAALAWGWSPATWRRHLAEGTATGPVLVGLVAVGWLVGYVLTYLANWQRMTWMMEVTN